MAYDTKVYDADQVSFILGGLLIDSGYADGEFITISPEADDFTDKAGTDGEVTRSKTNDRRATIELKLMSSSSGNALLSALSNLDKLAPGGVGVTQILIKDRQGTSLYTATSYWISKPPDVSFDREATERVWTIRCSNLLRLDGGN